MPYASVDHIRHPPNSDVQDRFGHRVEKLGAVDVGEMADTIDASRGGGHRRRVPDVTLHEFHVGGHVGQPPDPAARLVVEAANPMPRVQKGPHQCAADEPRATRDEKPSPTHALRPASLSTTVSGPRPRKRVARAYHTHCR